MSDLVGNPEDWFSHNEAHLVFAVHMEKQVILYIAYNYGQNTCTAALVKKILDSDFGHNYLHTPVGCALDFTDIEKNISILKRTRN